MRESHNDLAEAIEKCLEARQERVRWEEVADFVELTLSTKMPQPCLHRSSVVKPKFRALIYEARFLDTTGLLTQTFSELIDDNDDNIVVSSYALNLSVQGKTEGRKEVVLWLELNKVGEVLVTVELGSPEAPDDYNPSFFDENSEIECD
jgi:hypothetical protein